MLVNHDWLMEEVLWPAGCGERAANEFLKDCETALADAFPRVQIREVAFSNEVKTYENSVLTTDGDYDSALEEMRNIFYRKISEFL